MTDEFKYEGEDKKIYHISINTTSENEISVSFIRKKKQMKYMHQIIY